MWVFAEASHKNLVEYQKLIKIKPKAGTKFVYDKKDANVKMVAVDLRGAQNASVEVAERHVMSPQRFIKRIVDREIFTPTYETGQI
ncbi:MAG: hypothetical protein IAX21_07435 [Candidatus Bathyarchaeota archaeon]|nr:MAG: hypothetical protein IAX21_07435 [Candidatus Bathyarchaeota archaeon]